MCTRRNRFFDIGILLFVLTCQGGWGVPTAAAPALTEFAVPTADADLSYITNGPGGALWFIERKANKIARMTTSGDVTEFPVPTPVRLQGIAAGPDGNLWYVDQNGNTIGRVAMDGTITAFPIPAAEHICYSTDHCYETSLPSGIVAGPDRAMWFGENRNIGRVAMDGTITEFPLPAVAEQSSGANAIAAGPDGNLWFTLPLRTQIGMITPSGAVTTYAVPTAKSIPSAVTAGSDGNLWFVESAPAVSKIGSITSAGQITEYPAAPDSRPNTITTGPDNAIWFTENKANKVARLSPVAPQAAPQPSATPVPSQAVACSPFAPGSAFASPGFQGQWQQGEAIAANFWGPTVTGGVQEPYAEAPGGQRLVQYFDKGRMELTNPASGTVTNGLLANELITGQVQTGNAAFQSKAAATIPIAGDPDNAGPTYAALGTTAAAIMSATPAQTGNGVNTTIAANGTVTPGMPQPGAGAMALTVYDSVTQHNVPQAFAAYRDKVGLLTIGYAKSEPFLATVKVAGQQKQVMVQVFERRVLTYTADNPVAFQVEMGNIGQHYYRWRYCMGA